MGICGIKIKKYLPSFVLVLIPLLISLQNYTPGTWLTGWDTLHPEFDFPDNLSRLVFGVWRQEQGLGALAVHSHMADLPRVLLLWLSSLVLPIHFLRYFYVFLTLIAGPLGMYYFLGNTLLVDKSERIKNLASFLGAFFYLLNLGTAQHFYVPFEMFVTLFAFLPWLLLFATKYLWGGKHKHLVLFSLTTFLATPMAYAATLWYIYFANLAIYLSALYLQARSRVALSRLGIIIFATLLINSYWLLPNVYSLVTESKNVPDAKINQMFSENAFLHDKKYADLPNAALLKGFLFDWQMYDGEKFTDLFGEWRDHLQTPGVTTIGFAFFVLVVLGLLEVLRTKNIIGYGLLLTFIPSFIFLIHGTPGFDVALDALRHESGLFKEGLRFPWTKFSIFVMFVYATYFAYACAALLRRYGKILRSIFLTLLTLGLVIWTLPSFSGHIISSQLRTKIPDVYFEMYTWFQGKPTSDRIALFPAPTFQGWEYYKWGFEGAGFIWFGLPQPVLTRDFDRWSPYNENFYWEASYALNSQNQELFEKVLSKYQVSWILVDKNVIYPTSPKALYSDELEKMLNTPKFTLAQTFGSIQIYKVNLETPAVNFVFLAQNLPSIGPISNWNNLDTVYLENGNYLSSPTTHYSLPATIFYPFRSLFTGKTQKDIEFQVEELSTAFILKSKIPVQLRNYRVEIPNADAQDLLAFPQRAYRKDGYSYIHIPKLAGNLARKIDPAALKLPPCAKAQGRVVKLTSKDGATCSISLPLETLPHNVSYLITVKNQNVKGKPIVFWLENLNSRKADIETNFSKAQSLTESFFVQPPMDPFGQGYTLHFDNISIGKEEVINSLGEIEVQPLPFNFLRSIKLVPPNSPATSTVLTTPRKVTHLNPAFYEVTLNKVSPSTTLVLSQGFDKGWKAYAVDSRLVTRNSIVSMLTIPIVGTEIEDHVLVNNWANGWELDQSQAGLPAQAGKAIVIVYLPQYLEFAGFLLLFGFGISLAIWRRRATLPLR